MLRLNPRVGLLAALLALAPLSASAQTVAPPTPVHPSGQTVLVADGAPIQIQPAIGGTVVTYTQANSGTDVKIHTHDLTSGADVTIPNSGGKIDQLSDVSGTLVVFQETDVSSGTTAIMAYDTSAPAVAPLELDPRPNVRRTSAAIGGRTVAWQEFVGPSSLQTDIVAFNLDTHQVTRLTTDGASLINRDPAVSADGSVISWDKCPPDSSICQVFAATRRPDGTWGAAVQLTSGPEPSIQSATNGQIVVYVGQRAGEWDILWQPVGGGAEQRLSLPGAEAIPHISGSVVSFQSLAPGSSNMDILVYDIARGSLYQVTNTPDASERMNGIALSADGTVHVVWESAEDLYAFSFRLKVSFGDLCTQTRQFVQSSARYQALSAADKTRLDATTTSLCQQLASAENALTPTQKAQLVSVYQAGVNALAQQGWLTPAQAATLITLSKGL